MKPFFLFPFCRIFPFFLSSVNSSPFRSCLLHYIVNPLRHIVRTRLLLLFNITFLGDFDNVSLKRKTQSLEFHSVGGDRLTMGFGIIMM